MKKIFTLLMIAINFNSFSQGNDCGTKPKGSPIIFSEKEQIAINQALAVNQPYCIRIHVTVFANNNGSNRAASDDNIRRQIQNMANQYQAHNICFILMGIKQINDSDLNDHNVTGGANDESNEVSPYVVPGNLNIFIHESLPGLNGVAYGIPASNLSMWGGIIGEPQTGNITTLGHEVGHCLGLYHTFEPWADNNGNPTKRENVARSGACKNCTTNGDVLCDTPADDDGGVNVSCVYVGGGTDACGTTFTPMINNIMGYGFRPCRNIFTAEQGTRMRSFLISNATLNSFLVNDNLYLPVSANASIYWTAGDLTYEARDFIGISQFTNNVFNIYASANMTIVSKKISLKNGAKLTPTLGRIRITPNPYCN